MIKKYSSTLVKIQCILLCCLLVGCIVDKDDFKTAEQIEVPVIESPPQVDDLNNSFPISNTLIGTQAFSANYTFDDSTTELVEQAIVARDLGFKTFKFGLSERIFEDWELKTGQRSFYNLPNDNQYSSLVSIAEREPSVSSVLDMDFDVFSIWAYEFGENDEFVSSSSAYDDMYNLTQFLLTKYNGSGKVFLLGHWEGDWAVIGNFDPNVNNLPTERKNRYISWLNNRQSAIEAARQGTPHENVWVAHYMELNRVSDYLERGKNRLVNDVLPSVIVDAVSYSAYDAGTESVERNLDAIESFANLSDYLAPVFADKKVFIGEFGFELRNHEGEVIRDSQKQSSLSLEVLNAASEWGVPMAYYWQLYNNETALDGSERGFWLIDENNQRQPVLEALLDKIDE